jgi:alkylhydroperoxidase family enzyme
MASPPTATPHYDAFAYSPAVPRLREIPKSEADAPIVQSMYRRLFGDRDPVAEPGTATGTPGDWWTVFANSPDVLEHACRGFALYASPDRKIAPELRELGQTRAGWLVGSQFVFSQHCKSCRALGYSEDKIEALKAWQVSDLFSPVERALLAYTDALVLGFGRVDDAVFAAMQEQLSDEAILEFTYITMMYTMHAVISRALHLEYDERADPVIEIAAPADYTPENLGRQIGYDERRE